MSTRHNDNELIICRCNEVTKKEIVDAIKDGADSIAGIKRRTRAGMGLCQGKSCSRLVARIITEETGKKLQDIAQPTSRPPVRPVKLETIADENVTKNYSVRGTI